MCKKYIYIYIFHCTMLTFNESEPEAIKWSMSITDERKPAKRTSEKSLFFLRPITIAQDHNPTTPCTVLSESARSQSFCWMKDSCRNRSAAKQKIPSPRLETTEAVLNDWRRAWVFSVSDAIARHTTRYTKCHQGRYDPLSVKSSVILQIIIKKG